MLECSCRKDKKVSNFFLEREVLRLACLGQPGPNRG